MHDFQVFAPGTPVKLAGEVDALVLSVSIKGGRYVQYQCSWWNGNERREAWVEECEITGKLGALVQVIGLKG